MCSVINYRPKLHIAEKDIICYKYVNYKNFLFWHRITSKVYKFRYKLNKIYKTKLDPFIRMKDNYYSNAGFYSYKDQYSFCNAICIIPKGSHYYLTESEPISLRGLNLIYISDQIKIIKIL